MVSQWITFLFRNPQGKKNASHTLKSRQLPPADINVTFVRFKPDSPVLSHILMLFSKPIQCHMTAGSLQATPATEHQLRTPCWISAKNTARLLKRRLLLLLMACPPLVGGDFNRCLTSTGPMVKTRKRPGAQFVAVICLQSSLSDCEGAAARNTVVCF